MTASSICDINWNTWTATESATLLFVIQGNNILLIRKKTGLGKGKINGPGGRIEPDELPPECAIREIKEELCIDVNEVAICGELFFEFTNGYKLHAYVFKTDSFTGTPEETPEAKPLWFDIHALPYEEMWTDDKMWIPHMLKNEPFVGRFIFDDDIMVDGAVTLSQ